MVAENIIELTDLTKRYGSFTAVNQLNLAIGTGEIFGLLGPNGAGKSTTILMILGLTEPSSGSVKVCGYNPSSQPLEVKSRAGYLPEDVGFYLNRTGLDNLVFTGRLNMLSEKKAEEKAKELLVRVGLENEVDKKTGKYSRGMLQRLGLADVLIKQPEIIILDEPTLGIDPRGVREFLKLIVELSREEGITVLFSSHDLHQVQQVCDRVGLFVGGKLLAEGDIQSLSKKLFSNSPYTIELEVSAGTRSDSDNPGNGISIEQVNKMLGNLEGVLAVNKINERFQIECSHDITSAIARKVIESGAGLEYLTRKEYGLNDIYYRYFEGGEGHE